MDRLEIIPFVLATEDSVTLYWEKPMNADPAWGYRLLINGAPAVQTARTHITVEGLPPGQELDLTLQLSTEVDRWVSVWCGHPRTVAAKHRIDISKAPYHANGGGQILNTATLQRALDECGPDDILYFPAGVYLTGALRLHSNTEIYLEENAVLQGTSEISDYLPRIPSRFEGTEMECYSSLLNLGTLDHTTGPNCENILIHGKGTIASGGQVLAQNVIEDERDRLAAYLAENRELVASCENNNTIPGRVRPRLINLSNCKNVRISGLTLKNGASWNVHMIYCDHIITDHCTFISEGVWNGDGWDPDSSTNCTLFACKFFTGDDAVAIKSGKNPEGNLIARPSENIHIFDCFSAFGHGICIGSEMSGGIKNVHIWDCDLANSYSGIEIKSTRKRGGYVRKVIVQDCTAPRIMIHSVPYNDDGIPASAPPVFEGFRFDRIALTGLALDHEHHYVQCTAIEICGFDVPNYEIQNVVFNECIALNKPGIELSNCRNIHIHLTGGST